MIEWLGLENFRSFGERAVAEIAPITLVYGPNSAGKSSLVKSLLLLKQSVLESRSGRFRFDGPYVDLGAARSVAHGHHRSRPIVIEVGLGAVSYGNHDHHVDVTFSMGVDQATGDRVSLRVHGADGEEWIHFRRMGSATPYLRLQDIESAAAFDRLVQRLSGSELGLLAPEAERLMLTAFALDSMLPCAVVGRFASRQSTTLQRISALDLSAEERIWSKFAEEIGRRLRETVSSISYLGPLRKPWSRREPILADGELDGVGAIGQYAVNLLYRHPDLLHRVNASLEILETGYTLEVMTLGGGADGDVEGILPEELAPVLRHNQSGVRISPADAGFGLSQMLPILVESHLRQRSLICIEQPELHLHPRLQARVGTVLRNAVKGSNRNRYLIETHSEHLLLRLQSLIRQGLLESSSVSVVYVDNQTYDDVADRYFQSIASELIPLRLSSRGDLLDPWPGGFFEERWEELGFGGSHGVD